MLNLERIPHIMYNGKKENILSVLILSLGIILCICLDNNLGDNLFRKITDIKTKEEVIVGYNDIVMEQNGQYVTSGTDAWFLLSTQQADAIYLDFNCEEQIVQGKIYYRTEDSSYGESSAFLCSFYDGQVFIPLPDEEIYELRMDIEEEREIAFSIDSIYYCSAVDAFIYTYLVDILWGLLLLFLVCFCVISCKKAKITTDNVRQTHYIRVIAHCALMFTVMVVFKDYILGREYFMFWDIGSDTVQQYYPYYVNLVENIREGTWSAWNWEYGLGTSFMGYTYLLLDPFNLLVVLGGVLTGTASIKYMLLVSHIIKILLAFILCRQYLLEVKSSETAANIGAYLYAMNGYIMLWGQHYHLGSGVIYIVLVLLLIERLIHSDKKRWTTWLTLVFALAIASNYYNGYMILLFAAGYFLFRLFRPSEISSLKEKIVIMIKCLFAAISGVLIAAVALLPIVNLVFANSSRISSESGGIAHFLKLLFSFPGSAQLEMTLARMLSNNSLLMNNPTMEAYGRYTNYYEMPDLVFTCIIFVVIVQVIWVKWSECQTKKDYIYMILGCFCMLLLLFNQGIQVAFNAFTYVSYRYTFLLFPVFAWIFAKFWDACVTKRHVSLVGLVIGVVITAGILGVTHGAASAEVFANRIWIIVVTVAVALILVCLRIDKYKFALQTLLAVLVVGSTIFECYITNNQRSMQQADAYMLEYSDEGMVENSTTKILDYLAEKDSAMYRVEKTYADWTVLGDSLIDGYSGISYYNGVMNSNILDYYTYVYDGAYENRAIGVFTLEHDSNVDALALANVKYILSKTALEYEWCELLEVIDGIYIYRNLKADSMARWYTQTISKEEYEEGAWDERNVWMDDKAIVEDDIAIKRYQNATCEPGDFYMISPTHIKGSVKTSGNGILHLAIPDEEGWIVYIDNQLEETFNVNYGFVGVELDAGNHNIDIQYKAPLLKEGLLLSVFGCLCLGIFNIPWKRRTN